MTGVAKKDKRFAINGFSTSLLQYVISSIFFRKIKKYFWHFFAISKTVFIFVAVSKNRNHMCATKNIIFNINNLRNSHIISNTHFQQLIHPPALKKHKQRIFYF